MAITALVKYVFLDVVGFTVDRSVEAQTDIIDVLSSVVRGSLTSTSVEAASVTFLPTGDGLCIALLDQTSPFDIHVAVALEILARIDEHNRSTEDLMRRFQVRIGLNQNVDNVVTDINGQRNVAGAGVNTAQRVMSAGDGG